MTSPVHSYLCLTTEENRSSIGIGSPVLYLMPSIRIRVVRAAPQTIDVVQTGKSSPRVNDHPSVGCTAHRVSLQSQTL